MATTVHWIGSELLDDFYVLAPVLQGDQPTLTRVLSAALQVAEFKLRDRGIDLIRTAERLLQEAKELQERADNIQRQIDQRGAMFGAGGVLVWPSETKKIQ